MVLVTKWLWLDSQTHTWKNYVDLWSSFSTSTLCGIQFFGVPSPPRDTPQGHHHGDVPTPGTSPKWWPSGVSRGAILHQKIECHIIATKMFAISWKNKWVKCEIGTPMWKSQTVMSLPQGHHHGDGLGVCPGGGGWDTKKLNATLSQERCLQFL